MFNYRTPKHFYTFWGDVEKLTTFETKKYFF